VTDIWIAVAVVGIATVAIKASGPVLAAERELPVRLAGVLDLLAPALLAALVATQAFGGDERLVLDERAAGLAAAGAVVAARGPVIAAAVAAATVTALLRALT
jgi:branched-subunit amino acid transport protein